MRGRRGGAELEEEDEEILVCFVVQSLCLFSPANFVLHCPLHLCVQLLLPGIWRPILSFSPFFPPKYVFVVQSLCSYCLSFQFLFTLSLFNSLTVSLISFLIV